MPQLLEHLARPFLFRPRVPRRNPSLHRRPDRATPPVACEVEKLEERLVLSPGILAIGVGEGSLSRVGVFDSESGVILYEFNPYPEFPRFAGGVRTAVGYIPDFSGRSTFPVVITAPGPGLPISDPVRVYTGVGGRMLDGRNIGPAQLIGSANPFPGFPGGINVGAADFNLDGFTEIIAGAGEGGGPHVKIIRTSDFGVVFDQFVYAAGFTGGVRVAAGNINPGDQFPDLITAAGPSGGPHIKIFNGLSGVQFPGAAGSFFAYNINFTGGAYVSAGDFNGDGFAEVVTGAGPGGGPHVRIIPPFGPNPNDPAFDLNRFTTQFPFDINFRGGVRVAAGYINRDVIADLIVATGPGTNAFVRVFSGASLTVLYQGPAFAPNVTVGSFPSTGKFLGEALRIDGTLTPPGEGATPITTQDVEPLIAAALGRLEDAGVPPELLDELATLEIHVGNLGGNALGLARPGVVILDDDAAGFGWYIDPTPSADEEFDPDGFAIDPEALAGVDLLSVLLHEMGHHLGLEDLDPATDPQHLMTGIFNPGERRLPVQHATEAVFARDDLFDRLLAPSLL